VNREVRHQLIAKFATALSPTIRGRANGQRLGDRPQTCKNLVITVDGEGLASE